MPPSMPTPGPLQKFIKSASAPGLCLDASSRDGGLVGMSTCAVSRHGIGGDEPQAWDWDQTTFQVRAAGASGLCLDASEGVHLAPCDTGNPDQQWRYDEKTKTLSVVIAYAALAAELCLTASGRLHVWPCEAGSPSQRFDFGKDISCKTQANGTVLCWGE